MTPGNPADRLGHTPTAIDSTSSSLQTGRFQTCSKIRTEMSDATIARVALIESESPSALAAIEGANA
jgi:hypothetical protein